MKPTLLLPLLLAGLALAGCNSTTRSNTETTTAAEPTISPDASANASATDATYNNSLQSSSATTSANNVDTAAATPATPSTEPVTSSLPSSTYSTIDAARTTPTSTPDAESSPSSTTSSSTTPLPSVDVTASATQTPPAPSPNTSLTAESDRIPATVTPSDLPKTSADSTFSTPVPSSTLTGDVSGRLTEWKLNATDIQADLDRNATITRSKSDVVGAPTGASDDDVVETMVKGKLQADMHTSAAKIDVDAMNGEVSLKGTAANADAIGRAIALALDTQGVTKVSSDVKLAMSETPADTNRDASTPPPQN